MENILEFKQISKYYPGVTALNHVSLEIKKGEVHALVEKMEQESQRLSRPAVEQYSLQKVKLLSMEKHLKA